MRRQKGIALVAAIFFIVGLAALVAVTLRLSGTQAHEQSLESLHDRAGLAALAGAEWGAYRVRRQAAACPFSGTLPTLPGSLAAFRVQVQCQTAGGLWRLTATARHGLQPQAPDYVERTVSLEVTP